MKEAKVLLLQPPVNFLEVYNDGVEDSIHIHAPLSLAYIAASLIKEGHKVKIFDGQINFSLDDNYKKLKSLIKKYKPDVIGITVTTSVLHQANVTAELIKKINPKIKTILGGVHITALPKETMQDNINIDYGVFGEGEETVTELVTAIMNKKDISEVKGVIYRKNKKIIINPSRPFIVNLDDLPPPAIDIIPHLKKYMNRNSNFQRFPGFSMITSRGCPNLCIFCNNVFNKTVRFHSAERVYDEIKNLVEKYGIKEICFYDDNLMLNETRLKKICDYIIKDNLDIKWYCYGRVNNVKKDLLIKMKQAGCYMISFGVESGDEKVLKFIKKGITKEQVVSATKLTKKLGFDVRCSFMIGHPIDTKETIMKTIKFAKSLPLNNASFSIAVPYPGTELYHMAQKYGNFSKEDFKKFKRHDDTDLVFVPKTLTKEELFDLLRKARRQFYFRPSYIFKAIISIRSYKNLRKYIVGALGLFKISFFKLNRKH